MHKKALAAQRAGGDFDLTLRELMGIWSLGSTSAVSYHVQRFVEMGLFRTRQVGKRAHAYRAVDPQGAGLPAENELDVMYSDISVDA